ncbi:MAG: DUF302 domain-containing protein [Burkholderiaceae bacterium]
MKILSLLLLVLVATANLTQAQTPSAQGLVAVKSPYSAKETMDRFEAVVKEKNQRIFARVDHTAGGAAVNLAIRPTEVLIFGNPLGGTPLMQCAQTAGIDLPMKALAWQDEAGQVWLGYNDAAYLGQRHGVPQCPALAVIAKALAGFAALATEK